MDPAPQRADSDGLSAGRWKGVISVAVSTLDLAITTLPDQLDPFAPSSLSTRVERLALRVVTAGCPAGAFPADDPTVPLPGDPYIVVAHP